MANDSSNVLQFPTKPQPCYTGFTPLKERMVYEGEYFDQLMPRYFDSLLENEKAGMDPVDSFNKANEELRVALESLGAKLGCRNAPFEYSLGMLALQMKYLYSKGAAFEKYWFESGDREPKLPGAPTFLR